MMTEQFNLRYSVIIDCRLHVYMNNFLDPSKFYINTCMDVMSVVIKYNVVVMYIVTLFNIYVCSYN